MATAMLSMGRGHREHLAGWRLVEAQRDVRRQVGLVGFDREEEVPACPAELAAERVLARERVPRHDAPR